MKVKFSHLFVVLGLSLGLLSSQILASSSSAKASSKKRKRSSSFKSLEKERKKLNSENMVLEEKIKKSELTLTLLKNQNALQKQLEQESVYLENPYNEENRSLTLSDRQIHLNSAVHYHSAQSVINKIDFYNNQDSTKPIFLLVRSPGGSVIQGFKILNAIHHSPAPVYVIVKEYAASMAAIILAQAEHSFALPSALILFHEPSTFAWGNTSHLEHQLGFMKEIERRMMSPLLTKLGYKTRRNTLDSAITKWRSDLYKNSPSGDWMEFADKAHGLKWVNKIVEQIRDSSQLSLEPIAEKEKKSPSEHDEEDERKKSSSSCSLNILDLEYKSDKFE